MPVELVDDLTARAKQTADDDMTDRVENFERYLADGEAHGHTPEQMIAWANVPPEVMKAHRDAGYKQRQIDRLRYRVRVHVQPRRTPQARVSRPAARSTRRVAASRSSRGSPRLDDPSEGEPPLGGRPTETDGGGA